ncbi:MAG: hypothetical protein HZC40_20430 [Chloroflexi bacterium]|nr:hypothetical protein [Chloroflexota bacterium]
MMQQTALKYDVQVLENGRIEFSVPFPAGAHLTVFILPADDTFQDLLLASVGLCQSRAGTAPINSSARRTAAA